MNIKSFLWLAPTLGASIAFAQSPAISNSIIPSPTYTPKANSSATNISGCTPSNKASNRRAWCNDFNIDTNYEMSVPNTGVTKEYWLYVNDITANPDGKNQHAAVAVNNSIPGPTLFADWGDEVVVHVFNNLTQFKNGTSIHFHGIRQNYTNQNDGVVSLTQCPIAPGHSMTYKWRATQYGSSWYHSHIGLQAWEGVFGGIVINGPASENYDEDKGVLFLSDWLSQTVDELYMLDRADGPYTSPFVSSIGLMNGTNRNVAGLNNVSVGHYFNTTVSPGKKYRLRIVNSAINTHYLFKINNHNLTVIATDFVPIHSYTSESIQIGMGMYYSLHCESFSQPQELHKNQTNFLTTGQRYDVIFTADQAAVADSFWIQAQTMQCSSNSNLNVTGILSYKDNVSIPKLYSNQSLKSDLCNDESMAKLSPYHAIDVPSPTGIFWDKEILGNLTRDAKTKNFYRWYMNQTSMEVRWENPALMQIYKNQSLTDTIGTLDNMTTDIAGSNLIDLPNKGEWVYIHIVINASSPGDHPIHLHGHDLFILAQGEQGKVSDGTLALKNPPRRDTAFISQGSDLVIAFKADNPGIWLMHCHIGWHIEEGFALQFLEQKSEIRKIIDYDVLNDTCAAWIDYSTKNNVTEYYESGV